MGAVRISTVKMAKQETNTFSKHYFSVLKAFGITSRNPVESEIQMIDRWMKDYGFTTDIILEACARTINQTGKPSFQYADGILGAWHKNGVLSFSDIQEMDVRHKESRIGLHPGFKIKPPTNSIIFIRGITISLISKTAAEEVKEIYVPLKNSQYDEIMRDYNRRQLQNKHILDEHINEAYGKIPRLEEIDREISRLSIQKARALLEQARLPISIWYA